MEENSKISFFKKLVVIYFTLHGKKVFKDGVIKCKYPIIFLLGMMNYIFILGGWLIIAHMFDIVFHFKIGYISSILTFITWIAINVTFIYLIPCKMKNKNIGD